ncbi:uncharacterized protein LOC134818940 isoform X3 [Bolinopsis microptera]|uniref:uncharacterized protein LOC134818940 isoform X3 n=1 Tax=Bolinopsis microptera TaxID=2820187 RepID=UPI00307934E3
MSDDCEYELNALCQKLTKVLTDHECLTKTRSVYKAFGHIIKKVKNLGYVAFDSFLTDVKIVFSNLKRLDNRPAGVEDVEQKFAEELNSLISMDYYNSGNESDTSASDSAHFKKKKKVIKQEKSHRSPKKKKLSKTPVKSVEKTPAKAEKIKIKLKLTPNKMEAMSMTNFDFDANCSRVQSLCTALLKAANVRAGVQKAFTHLPDRNILPDYYDIIQLPISLSMIKESITKGLYTSLYHCYTDLLIMCVNAKTYNEPHTEFHDMSLEIVTSIKKHMTSTKMADKSLRTAINPQYEFIDYRPDGKKTKFNKDMFVDFWNMFCQAVSRCNKSGRPITSAFLRLIDEDVLPLYYEEIKNPVSLAGIRSKIIACKYENIMNLTEDITTMCDNAIHFNTKSSVISKDAVNLKDFVNSLAQAYIKEESETIPENKPTTSTSKVGEKRKAGVISRKKVPSKDAETSSPAVKKEKSDKVVQKSPLKWASVLSSVVTHAEESSSIEYLVFTCFNDLKDKGSEIQHEMVRIYSSFHNRIDSIVDFEDVLETTEDCRNVLLKVVCGMLSRIDQLCPEYSTIEDVLLRLVKADADSKKLFKCMPTYFYEGKKYFIQEELMTLFRHTPYSSILTHNTNVTRITKQKKELRLNVPCLDVLSEDIVLVDYNDVWRTLQTPLLDRLKKPNTIIQEPVTPKAGTAAVTAAELMIKMETEQMKTPKAASQRTPKSKTPKGTPQMSKTPKSGHKKLAEIKAEVIEGTVEMKPTPKKVIVGKAKAKKILNILKNHKDSSGIIAFDDFFSIPSSKSYHSVIKYPMSLDVIEQGLEADSINSVESLVSSCLLIVQNARYYNEEKSELHERALKLQKLLLSQLTTEDTSETIVLVNRVMLQIVDNLGKNTDIEELTRSDGNSKFVNMSFSQLRENVLCGYYTRFDRFQDELLHIIVSHMNCNQFKEAGTKLLNILHRYLQIRDKVVSIKSACFDLTMEKFLEHFQDRLAVQIPHAPITCLTFQNTSYMVGDKVRVSYSDLDKMILHINSVNSPCWLAGTVYFEEGDTLFKTDLKDIVHVKYVTNKVSKRFRYLSYNYRTKMTSDISTNKSTYCKHSFTSIFAHLASSRYSTQTVVHGTNDHKTYYLQFVRDNGDIFKVGDFVYLKSENDLPYIARIDKIHKDKSNHVWVYGPWFIRPSDTKFYDTKAFYPNECLMSSIADMNHINSVEGRCDILSIKDFTTRHPLCFLEKDVYICDNKYDESTHKFSKLSESKLYLTESVANFEKNEWYIYQTPRRIFKTTKPSFLKPVQVEMFSSSDDNSDSEVELPERGNVAPKPSSGGGGTPTVPRHTAQYQQGSAPRLIRAPGTQIARNSPDARIVVNNAVVINNNAAIAGTSNPRHGSNIRPKTSNTPSNVYHFSPLASSNSTLHSRNTTDFPGAPKRMCCRWGTCTESFANHNEFYSHVINTQTHLSERNNPAWKCFWVGCTDRKAKVEGCNTQILLRRHLMSHMSDSGFTLPAPAKRPKILRHSEAYKTFLNKLIIKKQVVDQGNMEMHVLED